MNKLAFESQSQIDAITQRVQAVVVQLNSLYASGRALDIQLCGIDGLRDLFNDIKTGTFLNPLSRSIRDSKFKTDHFLAAGNAVLKPLTELRPYLLQSEDGIVVTNTDALQKHIEQYRLYISDLEAQSIEAIKKLLADLQTVKTIKERPLGDNLFTRAEHTLIKELLSYK
jgi:hypothetical protein